MTFVAELRDKADQAARRPQSFRARDDIRSGLRSAVHGRYILLFRELDGMVRIERVMHSAQDFGNLAFD